jgi:hypothetical protein
MRITIHARVESAAGAAPREVEIGAIERADDADPASGLGLLLREGHVVLAALQKVILDEQVGRLLERAARCSHCQQELPRKDSKGIVYRTAFGKVRLSSPRLYSRCAACVTSASSPGTWSPLAEVIPDRTHPQWRWLQCRYASVMSYQLARIFLRDAFPGGAALPSSSVKSTVRAVGDRLESETRSRIVTTANEVRELERPVAGELRLALQLDAGYLRGVPSESDTSWFAAVASKLHSSINKRTHAHAYEARSDPTQGMRQQAFLRSVGIGVQVPVAIVSDGGEDIHRACQMPSGTERVLDWFHIGMRFEHPANGRARPTRARSRVEGAAWRSRRWREVAALSR